MRALRQISIELPPTELVTLLGPSGCGKTTLLRCIAGLEHPDEGEIVIGGDVVFSAAKGVHIPPHRRRVGMVFQNYAVWPHMTVAQNVAFPLEAAGVARLEIRRRVAEALRLVGLLEHADRPAPQLSGGQQQRVALARALVGEPRVLLLDEPLSNLDAKLRESMRLEIRELQRRIGITTVYVTHDQAEALSISDRVAVVADGRIVEVGAPRELYASPRVLFTAEFVGAANVFPIESLESRGDGSLAARCRLGMVVVEGRAPERAAVPLYLVIRPEDIVLTAGEAAPHPNGWRGPVLDVTFEGSRMMCRVQIGGAVVSALVTGRMHVAPGDTLTVHVPPERCVIVSAVD